MYTYKNYNQLFRKDLGYKNPILANIRANYEDILDDELYKYAEYWMCYKDYRDENPQQSYTFYEICIADEPESYTLSFINKYAAMNMLQWIRNHCPMLLARDEILEWQYDYDDMCSQTEYVLANP